jgi:hypothetical protein
MKTLKYLDENGNWIDINWSNVTAGMEIMMFDGDAVTLSSTNTLSFRVLSNSYLEDDVWTINVINSEGVPYDKIKET